MLQRTHHCHIRGLLTMMPWRQCSRPSSPSSQAPLPSQIMMESQFQNVVWIQILCTDAVKILCICLDKRKESKTFCMLHESIISSLKVWIHFLRFWCHVQTNTSFVFPFVYNTIVFYSLFRGTSLLFILGCDVTVCSVRYDVLLGMDFFQVKWLK